MAIFMSPSADPLLRHVEQDRQMGNEANRDEALKCLQISKQHWAANGKSLSLKYATKSVNLFETPEGLAWLEQIKQEYNGEEETEVRPEEPKTEPVRQTTPSSDAASSQQASFTAEQVAQVKRFSKINKEDYYAVLEVNSKASDADIKKSYRKLALQFHPDKNRAPGADEVFKVISKAFGVLGDPEKRRQYDRFGADISSGGGAGGHNPFSGAGGLDPEDIFRAFFGGAGGSPFGGASPFGNGGFHFQSFGGGGNPFFHHQAQPGARRRTAPQQQHHQHEHQRRQEQSQRGPASDFDRLRQIVRQLMPIIIFFLFSIISSWFSSSSGDSPTAFSSFEEIAELVSLQPGLGYPYGRNTMNMKVPYYVTSSYHTHFKDLDEALALAKLE